MLNNHAFTQMQTPQTRYCLTPADNHLSTTLQVYKMPSKVDTLSCGRVYVQHIGCDHLPINCSSSSHWGDQPNPYQNVDLSTVRHGLDGSSSVGCRSQGSECGCRDAPPPVPPPSTATALSALPNLSPDAPLPQEQCLNTSGEPRPPLLTIKYPISAFVDKARALVAIHLNYLPSFFDSYWASRCTFGPKRNGELFL